jgi:hypothetical protein
MLPFLALAIDETVTGTGFFVAFFETLISLSFPNILLFFNLFISLCRSIYLLFMSINLSTPAMPPVVLPRNISCI